MFLRFGLSAIILSTVLVGCGGGGEEVQPITDQKADQTSTAIIKATNRIQAQGNFQALGLSVTKGQKLKISSTGMVTVGLIDGSNQTNPRLKYYDANGGDHYGYNQTTQRWEPVVSLFNFNVGFQVGQTGVRNRTANATVVDLPITAANASYGPICSGIKRAVKAPEQFGADFFMGQPLYFIEPYRCVTNAKHGALIMKIVPKDKIPTEVEPVLVGKSYESTPYEVPADGNLYFAINDGLWIDDNQGEFVVTAEIIP